MSKACVLPAIASAVLLGGCFTSEQPILNGGGDRIALASETYACAVSGEKLAPLHVKEVDKGGGKYGYLVQEENSSAPPEEYTFHHVRGHRYIVTWFDQGLSTQFIALAHVDGSSLIAIKPDQEQTAQVAHKHNIAMGELALTGDLAAKEAFVDEMARTWTRGEIVVGCVGLPD